MCIRDRDRPVIKLEKIYIRYSLSDDKKINSLISKHERDISVLLELRVFRCLKTFDLNEKET